MQNILPFSFKSFSLFILLLLYSGVCCHAQYPKEYFSPPLKATISASGLFGELRSNHFHSGIDIRTNQQIGLPIFAPADGYVSRIKIQAFGGGKNLYITHPNGYFTVYMHLDRYSESIEKHIKQYQYEHQTYEFDIPVESHSLRVNKGDIIAYVGNSGSSSGPHLHYEIRNTNTGQTINPLLFGLPYQDRVAPTIQQVGIYPASPASLINGRPKTYFYNVKEENGRWSIVSKNDTILVSGPFYIGVSSYDCSSVSSNRNGIFRLTVAENNENIFEYLADAFSFNQSRYINSQIDYATFITKKQRYLLTRKQPGGDCPFVKKSKNNGVFDYKEEGVHKLDIAVEDFSKNRSLLDLHFQVLAPKAAEKEQDFPLPLRVVQWNKDFLFSAPDGSILRIPSRSLYDNIVLSYKAIENSAFYSSIHEIHSTSVPIHKPISLQIKSSEIPLALHEKALMIRIDGRQRIPIKGSSYQNGFVKGNISSFGKYAIDIDTIPPTIRPKNFVSNQQLKPSQKTLSVHIADNLSQIAHYQGTINGKWILMEFDGKTGTLTYTIDKTHFHEGKNILTISVQDHKKNLSEKEYILIK